MSHEFDSDRWYLAGAISRGIGRTWIVVSWGLSHVDPGDPIYMSAPTLAQAKKWLREMSGAPLHWHPYSDGVGCFGYCLGKYVEQLPAFSEEEESWT